MMAGRHFHSSPGPRTKSPESNMGGNSVEQCLKSTFLIREGRLQLRSCSAGPDSSVAPRIKKGYVMSSS